MMDYILPGVPPTGKKISIPLVAVVNIRGDRLYNGMWYIRSLSIPILILICVILER
jgi:hypothetical protein